MLKHTVGGSLAALLCLLGGIPVQAQSDVYPLEECRQLLKIGVYQSVVEEQCGFTGNVADKVQIIYSHGRCESVVEQPVIDAVVAEVTAEVQQLYNEGGTEGFCAASVESYQQLLEYTANIEDPAEVAAREEAARQQAMRDAEAGLLSCYNINCRSVEAIEDALRSAWMQLRGTPYDDMCYDTLANFKSARQAGLSDYDLAGDNSWFAACNIGLRNSQ
jgi:hypothetical protein